MQAKIADLRLLAAVYVVLSAALSWAGFDAIYENPEGSSRIPGTLTQIWPVVAQLGLACVMLALLVRTGQLWGLAERATKWSKQHYRACLFALLVIVAVGLAVGVFSLRAFPNSGDEYDYLFEAATFRAGRLWNPLPPVEHVFNFFWIDEKDGKWVAQYFPGWPLIIAGFTAVHVPAFVASPVLALLLAYSFSLLARLVAGPTAAITGTAILSLCPFFLLNGASYFTHVPTALFAVLFVLGWFRFMESGSGWWAALAGASVGAVGTIRPFTVFALALPAAVEFLLRAHRRHYFRIPVILAAGLPFLIGLLLYDKAITGNALLTPQAWTVPQLHIGLFPVDENGTPVSLIQTTYIAAVRLFRLSEWTSPLLCLTYTAGFLWKTYRRRIAFFDLIFPLLVFSYLFFPDSEVNAYGPRYYFDAYPFLVLTIITAAAEWMTELHNRKLKAYVIAALASTLIIATGAFPALAYQYHRVVNQRMELFDLVDKAHLSNAVVIIGSPTGSAFPSPMTPKDLTRNGINFSGSVIYALDVPDQNCALVKAFSGRSFYRYMAIRNRYPGKLSPVSPCPNAKQN